MQSKQKISPIAQLGFAPVIVIVIIVAIFAIGAGSYFMFMGGSQNTAKKSTQLSAEITAVLDKKTELVQALAADPELISLVEASSRKNSSLTQAEIKTLDDTWQSAEEVNDFIRPFLENETAQILLTFQGEHHEFPEIFVADKVGLNVGQTNKTSDYYQADEEWWINAYASGTGSIGHGEIEFDDSAKSESIALYVPIYNTQKQAIGVIKAVLSLSGIQREL